MPRCGLDPKVLGLDCGLLHALRAPYPSPSYNIFMVCHCMRICVIRSWISISGLLGCELCASRDQICFAHLLSQSPSTVPGILWALDKHLLDDEWMNCSRMVSTAERQPNLLSSPRAPKEANDGRVGSKGDGAKKQARNWKVHSHPGC